MDAVNRHPVDELADVREQIKVLEARETILRAAVLNGECGPEGDEHFAVITPQSRVHIDMPALKKHFGARLKPFMTERQVTFVRVWPKTGGSNGHQP